MPYRGNDSGGGDFPPGNGEDPHLDHLTTDLADQQALLALQDRQDCQLPYNHHLAILSSFRRK
jgi:hypothetical protein